MADGQVNCWLYGSVDWRLFDLVRHWRHPAVPVPHGPDRLVVIAAVLAQGLALFAQWSWMFLCLRLWCYCCCCCLISTICATFGWFLLVRIDIDSALDALLAHICPAVATAPFAFAFWTFELAKAPFLALVRRQTLSWRAHECTIANVVTMCMT